MGRNIELKVNVNSVQEIEKVLKEKFHKENPKILIQKDIFFLVNGRENERLKLRYFDEDEGELIAYKRADEIGPKMSSYEKFPTNNPKQLEETLKKALPILGVVRKVRKLYMIGKARIHLDVVEGLGDFMEFEVVLDDDEIDEDGEKIAYDLMFDLDVEKSSLVDCAYIDLLRKKREKI